MSSTLPSTPGLQRPGAKQRRWTSATRPPVGSLSSPIQTSDASPATPASAGPGDPSAGSLGGDPALSSRARAKATEWFTSLLPSGRIVAIDVARFIALVGMVVAHTAVPFDAHGNYIVWIQSIDGRASALFAILAGVSLALVTGGSRPVSGRAVARSSVTLAVRAVLLVLIGLGLAWHNDLILVILPVYGFLFLLSTPLLHLRAESLLVIAGGWAVLGPVFLFLCGQSGLLVGMGYYNLTFTSWHDPGNALMWVFVTGTYPALVWFTYVVLGLGIGRLDLRSWKPAAWLVGVGSALVLVAQLVALKAPTFFDVSSRVMDRLMEELPQDGVVTPELGTHMKEQLNGALFQNPWTLASAEAHTGTIGDVVTTSGSAMVAIGLCLLLVRGGFRVWSVLFGAGAMTLTLYVVHIQLVNTAWGPFSSHPLASNLAVLVGTGLLFGLLRRSGPLEALVSAVSKTVGRWVPAPTPEKQAREPESW